MRHLIKPLLSLSGWLALWVTLILQRNNSGPCSLGVIVCYVDQSDDATRTIRGIAIPDPELDIPQHSKVDFANNLAAAFLSLPVDPATVHHTGSYQPPKGVHTNGFKVRH